jgi:hypothetical protein
MTLPVSGMTALLVALDDRDISRLAATLSS